MQSKKERKQILPLAHLLKALPLHESDILTLLTHTKTLSRPGLRYPLAVLSEMINTDLYDTLRSNTYAFIRKRKSFQKINYKELIKISYPKFDDALNELPLIIQIFAFLNINNPILNHLKIVKGNICKDGFYFYAVIANKKIKFKFPFKLAENFNEYFFKPENEEKKFNELKIRNLSKESIFNNKFNFKKLKIITEEKDSEIVKEFVKGRRILKNVLNLYKELINEIINTIKKRDYFYDLPNIFTNKSFKIDSYYKDVYSMIIQSNGGIVSDTNYEYVIKDSFSEISDDICIHPQFLFDSINENELQDVTKYMGVNLPKQKCVFEKKDDEFVISKSEKIKTLEENFF